MNLGFVILYVDDTEKSKAFYTNILGMAVVEEISGPNFVTLRPDGGSLIGLQDKKTAQFAPKDEAHGTELRSERCRRHVGSVEGAGRRDTV